MRKAAATLVLLLAGTSVSAQPATPAGAAACSGCHPRAGASALQPLAGRAPDEIVAAMRAFRTGERSATVMDRIARGFSEDETKAIAAWVSVHP